MTSSLRAQIVRQLSIKALYLHARLLLTKVFKKVVTTVQSWREAKDATSDPLISPAELPVDAMPDHENRSAMIRAPYDARTGRIRTCRQDLMYGYGTITPPVISVGGLHECPSQQASTPFCISNYTASPPGQVYSNLYISDVVTARQYFMLTNPAQWIGVRHVLSICDDRMCLKHYGGFKDSRHKHSGNMQVYTQDKSHSNLIIYLPDICAYLERSTADGPTLVHCIMGISRSSTAVIAYMLWKYKMTLASAYWYTYKARRTMEPNRGFTKQLEVWNSFLRETRDLEVLREQCRNVDVVALCGCHESMV